MHKTSSANLPGEIGHGDSPSNPGNSADHLGRWTQSAAFLPQPNERYPTLPDLASVPLPPHSAIVQLSHLLARSQDRQYTSHLTTDGYRSSQTSVT